MTKAVQSSALERALDLLTKIRYCTWPTPGLGIGINPAEIDDILIDGDADLVSRKIKNNFINQKNAQLTILKDAAEKVCVTFHGCCRFYPYETEAIDNLKVAAIAAGVNFKS